MSHDLSQEQAKTRAGWRHEIEAILARIAVPDDALRVPAPSRCRNPRRVPSGIVAAALVGLGLWGVVLWAVWRASCGSWDERR